MQPSWEKILSRFRELGGVADNVTLGEGSRGRGLFPINNAEPVRLFVPDSLLVPAPDVEFNGGELRVKPNSSLGRAERDFFEAYQNIFSWGGGARADCEQFVKDYDALPDEIVLMLFGDDRKTTDPANFNERVETFFVQSRKIQRDAPPQEEFEKLAAEPYGGTDEAGGGADATVLMPILDLANHDPNAQFFGGINGVEIQGIFSSEILVRYTREDALGIFRSYGFASPERTAFCLVSKYDGAHKLTIERDMHSKTKWGAYSVPKFSINDGAVVLSRMMLGSMDFPRLPRGIFCSIVEEAGWIDAEEEFDKIAHRNRMRFLNLLRLLQPHHGGLVPTLRLMAIYQLEAMSHCVGRRRL